MTTLDTSSIDALLDGTLDDLADIPEFKPFNAGAHRVTINWEMKKIGDKVTPVIKMKMIESLEIAADATPDAAGSEQEVAFMLTKKDGTPNELGQGQLKSILATLAQQFGTKTNRETMEASKGAEVIVVTGIREDKRDPNNIKHYTDLKALTFA